MTQYGTLFDATRHTKIFRKYTNPQHMHCPDVHYDVNRKEAVIGSRYSRTFCIHYYVTSSSFLLVEVPPRWKKRSIDWLVLSARRASRVFSDSWNRWVYTDCDNAVDKFVLSSQFDNLSQESGWKQKVELLKILLRFLNKHNGNERSTMLHFGYNSEKGVDESSWFIPSQKATEKEKIIPTTKPSS